MMPRRLADWLYKHLADEHWGGGECPPGSMLKMQFGPPDDDGKPMYTASTVPNEGHELWIGTRNGWRFFVHRKYAMQLAIFILWQWWAKATWFGLKRRIWYAALSASNRHQRIGFRSYQAVPSHKSPGTAPERPDSAVERGTRNEE